MDKEEVRRRLGQYNRMEVHRETGIPYMWLARLEWGKINDPRSTRMDQLRAYLLAREIREGAPR